MNCPDQVWSICLIEIEAELPLRVSFGVARFLHSRSKLDENDFVSSGWPVGGAIGDGAGQSGGRCRIDRGNEKDSSACQPQNVETAAAGCPSSETRSPMLS